MSKLFKRYLRIVIGNEKTHDGIEIEKLRCHFEVTRDLLGFPNLATVRIYNLTRANREFINIVQKRNLNALGNDESNEGRLAIYAGYEESNGLIFKGDIMNIIHLREGVDMVTEILAKDGAREFQNGFSNFIVSENTKLIDVLLRLQRDWPTIAKSEIRISSGDKKLFSKTICEPTKDVLNKLGRDYGFHWSFQNHKYTIIDYDTVLNARAIVINNRTGMIDSPIVTEKGVDVKSLLNWEIKPYALIKVESQTEAVQLGNLYYRSINKTLGEGEFKVMRVVHTGDNYDNAWESMITGYKRNAETV